MYVYVLWVYTYMCMCVCVCVYNLFNLKGTWEDGQMTGCAKVDITCWVTGPSMCGPCAGNWVREHMAISSFSCCQGIRLF